MVVLVTLTKSFCRINSSARFCSKFHEFVNLEHIRVPITENFVNFPIEWAAGDRIKLAMTKLSAHFQALRYVKLNVPKPYLLLPQGACATQLAYPYNFVHKHTGTQRRHMQKTCKIHSVYAKFPQMHSLARIRTLRFKIHT